MKTRRLKRRHLIVIGVVVLLLAVYYIIPSFLTSSSYAASIPFTGRLLDVHGDELTYIRFQSGSTGLYIDYRTEAELEEAAEYLNAFRYIAWAPDLPRGAGWSYGVTLGYPDGSWSFCLIGEHGICVDGVWYFALSDYFGDMLDALDALEPEPEPEQTTLPASNSDIPIAVRPSDLPATDSDIGQ